MSECRVEGCDYEALPARRGLYANLCAQHKQEKWNLRHNGEAAELGAALADESFVWSGNGANWALSISELQEITVEIEAAWEELMVARGKYRAGLERLQALVAVQLSEP